MDHDHHFNYITKLELKKIKIKIKKLESHEGSFGETKFKCFKYEETAVN